MVCKKCGLIFKTRIKIDGISRVLKNRKYCLICSPFGSHNTTKLEKTNEHKNKNNRYRKWQRKARKERKDNLVKLLGGKCSICGYNKSNNALDFHHIEPKNKLFSISQYGLCRKWVDLVTEAKKCIVLCRNCHAELEHNIAA